MKITQMQDMTRGWFIGDFEPSVLRTKDFEVGYLTHKAGEFWAPHVHKEAVEINYLISGKMTLNDVMILPGMIFMIERGEVAKPVFLEDCSLIVVKSPSVIGDKYAVVSND